MQTPAERFPRLRELFHELVDLPAGEREKRLAGLPGEDGDLLQPLRELLAASDAAEDPVAAALSEIETELEPDPAGTALVGRRIGAWEVVRLIGHGGMGSVFLARRADGAFTQEVALKLIRPGLASRQLVHRFRDERQALASLAHPRIARLLDGGTTEDGLPYLVMEHVEGANLEEHCAALGLGLDERLDLFLSVCAAVEHAHRNLVVHRDLKPGNILVDEAGEPRLLDFGIAKLLGRSAGEGTQLTQGAATLGTVAFASPEQLRGEAVTTANDVYSLGVILYRLLSGRHPYDLNDAPLPEAMRRACESEPPPPSRAAADAGDTTAARALRGDLDKVILLALRKPPAERYPSVAAFAADLRAWRAGLPVSARQPTLRYRAAKLVRRHRLGVAAAAVTLLSLVGGLGAAGWSAHQAREEARRAELERAKAEKVSEFLQELLGATESSAWLAPRRGPHGARVTVAELLDAAARRLDELGDQPAIEAALRRTLGGGYAALGLYAPAERELRRAVALSRRAHGERHPETARSWADLGHSLFLARKTAEAEPILRRALALYRSQHEQSPIEEAKALNAIGLSRLRSNDLASAERLLDEALALARSSGDAGRSIVLVSRANLGQLLHARGDLADAETIYREVLALQSADQPGWEVAFLKYLLGTVVFQQGETDEGERLLRESIHGFASTAGESFLWAASPHTALAELLRQRGDLAGAEAEARRALEILSAAVPPGSAEIIASKGHLGSILVAQGRAAEGEPLLRQALADAERSGSPGLRGAIQSGLGECLLALGRRAEAAPLLRSGYRILLATAGAENAYTRRAAERLARLDALR
jgi:tetratricopeptide (TPR) repeat protein